MILRKQKAIYNVSKPTTGYPYKRKEKKNLYGALEYF